MHGAIAHAIKTRPSPIAGLPTPNRPEPLKMRAVHCLLLAALVAAALVSPARSRLLLLDPAVDATARRGGPPAGNRTCKVNPTATCMALFSAPPSKGSASSWVASSLAMAIYPSVVSGSLARAPRAFPSKHPHTRNLSLCSWTSTATPGTAEP